MIGAIVLAGGRGSRLGGVSKADLVVGGERLLDRVLGAVAGCTPRIVVAPVDVTVPSGVIRTRENPPLSGPAAAVAAATEVLDAHQPVPGWVLLLACDLPGVAAAVGPLCGATVDASDDVDAFWASADSNDAWVQWLVAVVRTRVLANAVDALGPGGCVDSSMGRLLGGLTWRPVAVPATAVDDIDTPADQQRWVRELS